MKKLVPSRLPLVVQASGRLSGRVLGAAEPGHLPAARAERRMLPFLRRVHERPAHLAGAPDEDVGKIPARPALVEVQLPRAVRPPSVDEPLPVDVADVPVRTGPHEPDRHHILVPPALQRAPVKEPTTRVVSFRATDAQYAPIDAYMRATGCCQQEAVLALISRP